MRPPTLVVVLLLLAMVGLTVPASADGVQQAEAELEAARERRAAVEERLATEAGDLEGLEHAVHDAQELVDELAAEDARLRGELDTIAAQIDRRTRLAYMHGNPTAVQLVMTGQNPSDVAERATLLESLSLTDRAAAEQADALRAELAANQQRREEELASLAAMQEQLRAQVDQLMADLEQLQRDEERFSEELEREREEARRRREEELRRRREAEERRAREAAAARDAASDDPAGGSSDDGSSDDGSGDDGGSAPSGGGGYACPVGNPVFFSDTWGAPRSGGRSHKGVDMMAPHGTPVYAITSGKITRMNGNRLGGISLYMFGDDGNQYYYTHLQGYDGGAAVGARVAAGDLVARVGSTGNASASAPHLHLEVHPGGGGAVNPYPWAAMACGR